MSRKSQRESDKFFQVKEKGDGSHRRIRSSDRREGESKQDSGSVTQKSPETKHKHQRTASKKKDGTENKRNTAKTQYNISGTSTSTYSGDSVPRNDSESKHGRPVPSMKESIIDTHGIPASEADFPKFSSISEKEEFVYDSVAEAKKKRKHRSRSREKESDGNGISMSEKRAAGHDRLGQTFPWPNILPIVQSTDCCGNPITPAVHKKSQRKSSKSPKRDPFPIDKPILDVRTAKIAKENFSEARERVIGAKDSDLPELRSSRNPVVLNSQIAGTIKGPALSSSVTASQKDFSKKHSEYSERFDAALERIRREALYGYVTSQQRSENYTVNRMI